MKRAIMMLCLSAKVFGQTNQKIYSLDECIGMAMKNNHSIKAGLEDIKRAETESKSYFDLPKTAFMFTQGQFNSVYKYDNQIAVSQSLPFPTALTNKKSYFKSSIKQARLTEEANEAQLKYWIKSSYYHLAYFSSLERVMIKEDSVYRSFYKIELKKYQEGKATLLEKIEIESKLMDISGTLLDVRAQINYYTNAIKTVTQSKEDFKIKLNQGPLELLPLISDTTDITNNPALKAQYQLLEVQDNLTKMERATYLPDFTVGYFNLSIYGPANIGNGDYFLTPKNRLSGFTLGMNVPIWFYASAQKVKAAKQRSVVVKENYENQKALLSVELNENIERYYNYKKGVDEWRDYLVKNSESLREQALLEYLKGDINFMDYINIVGNTFGEEAKCLEFVHHCNEASIRTNYLLHKEPEN